MSKSRYVWLPLLLLGVGIEGEGKGGRRGTWGKGDVGRGVGGLRSSPSITDGQRDVRAVMLWRDEWSLNDFLVARQGRRAYKRAANL